MVQVTTPPVVTAQHGTGNPPIRFGNQAEARLRRKNAAMAGRVSDSFNPTPSVRRHNAMTAS
ncbi:MAG: hypothetical protein WAO21_07730 [Verrucomicrobiia bacterium]|jgi:hypothetical protein